MTFKARFLPFTDLSVKSRLVTIATGSGVRWLATLEPFDGWRAPTRPLLFRTEPAIFDS